MRRIFSAFSIVAVTAVLGGCGGGKDFTEFSSAEHKFKAQFPGAPTTKKQTIAGGVEQTIYTVTEADGGYFVFHQENPAIPAGMEKFLLKQTAEAMNLAGKVTSTSDITLEGKYPGVQVAATVNNPPGSEIKNRIYLVNNKLYQVMALGKPAFVNSDRTTKFLDSFKLTP